MAGWSPTKMYYFSKIIINIFIEKTLLLITRTNDVNKNVGLESEPQVPLAYFGTSN